MATKQIAFDQLPLHVSIIGSRSFESQWKGRKPYPMQEKIERFVNKLNHGTIVCSGGAIGGDSWAEEAAKARGLKFVPFYPAEKPRNEDGSFNFKYITSCFARNTQIADWAATNGGLVIGFVDVESVTGGTYDTLRKARGMDCPTIVFKYKKNGQSMGIDVEGINPFI